METIRVFDGSQPESPLFAVYLCALRGPKALKVLVRAEGRPFEKLGKPHHASDIAMGKALRAAGAPECAFVAVYQVDTAPPVSARYGAPMGRRGHPIQHDDDLPMRAARVPLDSGGYDRGGAYWGLRPRGLHLYAVQDGLGGLEYVDAPSSRAAIATALEG